MSFFEIGVLRSQFAHFLLLHLMEIALISIENSFFHRFRIRIRVRYAIIAIKKSSVESCCLFLPVEFWAVEVKPNQC